MEFAILAQRSPGQARRELHVLPVWRLRHLDAIVAPENRAADGSDRRRSLTAFFEI